MLRLFTKCCKCPWRPPVDEEQFAYKKLSSSSNGEPTQSSASQINQNAPQTTNYDGEDFDSSIPETFICSITGQIMKDPVVVAGSGNVYERQAITRWLEKSDKDPMTNLMLKDKQLVPLHALKSQIQEFQFRRQQFHQQQQQLQNNQIGQNTEGQGREVSAQIPRAIEQTNFQRIIDEFGDVFVFLFKNISRKKSVYLDYKSVFTDQYTRQALLNLPNEIDQIDKDVKMLQDEYDAITDYQNARDTSEEISKITSQILDLQQQKKDKLAKLEVAQKVREHLQIYSSAGSSSKTYKCIQLQGLKPTKYVPTSSTLMVATARFEKAVIILQAEISRILSKEVSIEKLDEELQNAVVRQQAERKKKSEQLRFAIGSESSVGNAKLIQEEQNKADETSKLSLLIHFHHLQAVEQNNLLQLEKNLFLRSFQFSSVILQKMKVISLFLLSLLFCGYICALESPTTENNEKQLVNPIEFSPTEQDIEPFFFGPKPDTCPEKLEKLKKCLTKKSGFRCVEFEVLRVQNLKELFLFAGIRCEG
eukprot:TRINITY_DN18241_c0_g1_i8.p1 TRINITY_DN18241_c0_g1~~TRINITY_DN18241_c0_g1_i8.p1  ORF type:complete len:534 (-),score=68.31 TRINITY_DN18241_c0_g1_i8:1328-2929(-)